MFGINWQDLPKHQQQDTLDASIEFLDLITGQSK
jgi:hypothetical protein